MRARAPRGPVRPSSLVVSIATGALLAGTVAASVPAAAHDGADHVDAPAETAPEDAPAPSSLLHIDTLPRVDGSLNKRGALRRLDLGLTITAPDSPVSFWSHRPSYDEGIVTEVRTDAGVATLPAGTLHDFNGLTNLLSVTVTEVGATRPAAVVRRSPCLNGWSSTRIRPDAPARSPYPWSCSSMPYTLGSVMGIEGGWSTRVQLSLRKLELDRGRYDVVTTVNPGWREALGISEEDGTSRTRMRVYAAGKHPDYGHGGGYGGGYFRTAEAADAQHTPAAAEPAEEGAEPPAGVPVPDLRSLPAWQIGLARKGTVLRFAATVWNGGESPLVIDGFRDGADRERMTTYQYFFDSEGEQVGYQQVGEMRWHAANHNHWHLDDFAKYSLLDASKNEIVKSTKRSFCLANTDAVDYTVPGANWKPSGTDLSTACGDLGAMSVREVLDSGSGDTYHQYRAGQAFRIGDLPNGTYYIATTANPLGNLVESDTTNNEALREIRLVGKPGMRRVVVPQVGIIDENQRRRGSFGWF